MYLSKYSSRGLSAGTRTIKPNTIYAAQPYARYLNNDPSHFGLITCARAITYATIQPHFTYTDTD